MGADAKVSGYLNFVDYVVFLICWFPVRGFAGLGFRAFGLMRAISKLLQKLCQAF